jgi:hypothetical protein
VPKRCALINVINKCCTLFVFFLYGFLVFLRQGIPRGSPPGTTTEVQRVGFPSAEIRFVSYIVFVSLKPLETRYKERWRIKLMINKMKN